MTWTKLFSLISLIILTGHSSLSGQGISINENGMAPDNSSIVDIQSNEKGMLIPRMTEAQRMAIATPANGLLVYDISSQSFWFYNGSGWEELVGGNDNVLQDTDTDTKIQVEASPDEDRIRIDIA